MIGQYHGSTRKISFVYFTLFSLFLVVVAFLFRWQYLMRNQFFELATQRDKQTRVNGLRGSIFAGDGTYLAYSERAYDLYVSKSEIDKLHESGRQNKYEFYDALSESLEMKSGELEEIADSAEGVYVKVLEGVSEKQKAQVDNALLNDKALLGIYFEEHDKRIYPNENLASHVLGFVGQDDSGNAVGRTGIEEYWDGDLVPKEGVFNKEVDSKGNIIITSNHQSVDSLDGRDIYLTINPQVQKVVEKKIKEWAEEYNAKSGSVVIENPKTGEIIAMANYPDFNPGKYGETENVNDFNNRAIVDVYENGSVWKAFTISAAINEGYFEPDSVVFNSHHGCILVIEGKKICTAYKNSVTKPTTLREVIKTSDNIGSYLIAKEIGSQNLYDYLIKFGIGNYTNLGLANEQTDVMLSPDKWSELDLGVISFGQSEAGTLMQTVSGYSAIANYGVRMQPRVVSKLEDKNRTVEFESEVANQVITSKTAEEVVDVLVDAFEAQNGQYYWRGLENYKIAGKTGTAQIPEKDGLGYKEDATNVTVIGFDASENRKFVMGIRLEEPEGGLFSFESAFPAWVDILKNIKDYLEVETTL